MPSLSDQINSLLSNPSLAERIKTLDFGDITFQIRKGTIYRALVVHSVLIKDVDVGEKRDVTFTGPTATRNS